MAIVAVPDKAIPPANVLREELEHRGLTAEQLAPLMGWDVAEVEALVAGDAPMTEAAAVALELALGVDAGLWMHLEAAYRSDLDRLAAFTRARKG